MKLLIITQKVNRNDAILGFFHRWIEEFAKHCEKLTVICLEKGEYDLPDNVKVLSLGKEEGKGRFVRVWRFYKHIWKERKEYDSVFVHMNQVYVILGGLFWRVVRKNISLWYTHKSVTSSLRIAERLVHNIFSASKESFRLKTKKLNVMGHGIDTDLFKPTEGVVRDEFKLLTVGRISKTKRIDLMISVLSKLSEQYTMDLIGDPITDEDYLFKDELIKSIREKKLENRVRWVGVVGQNDLPEYYSKSGVFINLSNTGSLDKAVLEAMSSGMRVVTSNEAFKDFDVDFINTDDLLDAVLSNGYVRSGREVILQDHNLSNLIKCIIEKI